MLEVPAGRHAGGQDRLHLGRQVEHAAVDRVVERLGAEAVARGEQQALPLVPQDERELSAQPRQAGGPALLVQVDQDLAVGAGAEAVAAPLQLGADRLEAVELAVDDDLDRAVLVRDRLITGLEIDDGEPRVCQAGAAIRRDPAPPPVGAAVVEDGHGGFQAFGRHRLARRHHGHEPAHRIDSRSRVSALSKRPARVTVAGSRMTAPGSPAIVLPATVGQSGRGRPSPLLAPFGGCSSLLAATVRRLVAFELGRITVVTPEAHGREVRVALAGEPIDLVVASAAGNLEEIGLARHGVEQVAASEILLVDPRAAFVSAHVARAVIEGRRSAGADIAMAPTAPRGLASLAVSRAGFDLLARAAAVEGLWDADLDLIELARRGLPFWPGAIAVRIDDSLECPAAELFPADPDEAARLSPLAMAPDDHDYRPALAADAAAAWARWDALPARRPRADAAPARFLLAHYLSTDYGSTLGFGELAAGLAGRGHPVTAVLPYPAGKTREMLLERGVPVLTVPSRFFFSQEEPTAGRWWADDVAAFAHLIDETRPDAIVISGFVPALAVAARLRGLPAVVIARTPIFDADPYQRFRMTARTAITAARLVCAISPHFAGEIARAYAAPPGRVRSVPYGIRVDAYSAPIDPAAAARFRAEHRLPAGAALILQVGSLIGRKQPELAIRALARLRRLLPACDARLVLAGKAVGADAARYRDGLAELAAGEGVGAEVVFLGPVAPADMPALYRSCDILLHAAYHEPFGRVLAEALVSGLPVVAVRSSGPELMVLPGETGLLVDAPGDAGDLARALAELAGDPARRAAMSARAAEDARARLSTAAHVEAVRAICLDLAGLSR
jgi:glycosyltransferase involved in cell wall biosynthesis